MNYCNMFLPGTIFGSCLAQNAMYGHFYFGVMDGKEDKVDEFLANYGVDTTNGLPTGNTV